MIVITLALASAMTGSLSRLGYMRVSNQATNKRHPKYGDYKAEFYTKTGKLKRTVYVKDYARKKDSVYELLAMVMAEYKRVEKEEKQKRKDAKGNKFIQQEGIPTNNDGRSRSNLEKSS